MDSYIAHHGVKGQKWGVRRFQNEDGSLNEKGKKKQEKQYFKQEVKAYKKQKGMTIKVSDDGTLTNIYDSKGNNIGFDYAQKVMRKGSTQKLVKNVVGTVAVMAGANVALSLLTSLLTKRR